MCSPNRSANVVSRFSSALQFQALKMIDTLRLIIQKATNQHGDNQSVVNVNISSNGRVNLCQLFDNQSNAEVWSLKIENSFFRTKFKAKPQRLRTQPGLQCP